MNELITKVIVEQPRLHRPLHHCISRSIFSAGSESCSRTDTDQMSVTGPVLELTKVFGRFLVRLKCLVTSFIFANFFILI